MDLSLRVYDMNVDYPSDLQHVSGNFQWDYPPEPSTESTVKSSRLQPNGAYRFSVLVFQQAVEDESARFRDVESVYPNVSQHGINEMEVATQCTLW